jgi:hypothetical protein
MGFRAIYPKIEILPCFYKQQSDKVCENPEEFLIKEKNRLQLKKHTSYKEAVSF